MTRDIGLLPANARDELLSALGATGFSFRNPGTGEIVGWDACGEKVILPSEEAATAFLAKGNGVQFWRGEARDLFVSVTELGLSLSFDGFSPSEQAELLSHLARTGVTPSVIDEDEITSQDPGT